MTKEVLLDPALFEFLDADPADGYRDRNPDAAGPVRTVSTHDSYFELEGTRALGIVLDGIVGRELSDEAQQVIRLRVDARMSYAEIATEMGWWIDSDPPYPNKKRAWREVKAALEKLRDAIHESPQWSKDLIGHRLPEDDDA